MARLSRAPKIRTVADQRRRNHRDRHPLLRSLDHPQLQSVPHLRPAALRDGPATLARQQRSHPGRLPRRPTPHLQLRRARPLHRARRNFLHGRKEAAGHRLHPRSSRARNTPHLPQVRLDLVRWHSVSAEGFSGVDFVVVSLRPNFQSHRRVRYADRHHRAFQAAQPIRVPDSGVPDHLSRRVLRNAGDSALSPTDRSDRHALNCSDDGVSVPRIPRKAITRASGSAGT
jgi:hypothetical protein